MTVLAVTVVIVRHGVPDLRGVSGLTEAGYRLGPVWEPRIVNRPALPGKGEKSGAGGVLAVCCQPLDRYRNRRERLAAMMVTTPSSARANAEGSGTTGDISTFGPNAPFAATIPLGKANACEGFVANRQLTN